MPRLLLTTALAAIVLAARLAHAQAPAQGAVLLTLEGRGVQIYRCEVTAPVPTWILDHPEADLLDDKGKVIGHHGAGPLWRMDDGSSTKGELLEKMPAPEPGAIPWLLLRATVHQGKGLLTNADTIRRTETHGGTAPIQVCDAARTGATARVPYTATYTFYGKP